MPHVALVGPEIEENLSLRYLAASVERAGFQAEIIPLAHDDEFGPALAAILGAVEPPAVVGVSLAFQWRARDFLALAIALRQGGYRGHITAGGHFATFAAAEILRDFPEIDSVCKQEAEDTFTALARAIAAGRSPAGIPGLVLRGGDGALVDTGPPPLPDLAALPWPDRRGEPARCFDHAIAPLVSSRGCYANCTFCCIAAWQEQALPGKRYRLRDPEAVADEMVALKRERGVDIFVFHDDNFFVPGHRHNRERLTALADALDARGIGRFATVVKARPTDVDPEVFAILRRRLGAIRVYIGIESDADQGLDTLRRWSSSRANHRALDVVRSLDLYTCFNVLLWDPDSTLESVATNIDFLEGAADCAFNFGRVELYAGTPLLARMLAEGRCTGDYLQYDYRLASPEVDRMFEMAIACFHERNFADDALANRMMATRFDVEVVRHFHPDLFRPAWRDEAVGLSRALALDSARGLRAILDHVRSGATGDARVISEVSRSLRAAERALSAAASDLAARVARAVGRGAPLTDIGDRVATPLQQPRVSA